MDNCPGRRIDRQRHGILNTVISLDKLNPEISECNGLSRPDHLSARCFQESPFLQLMLDQTHGEFRGIQRNIDFLNNVRYGADMIFMAVGEYKPLYLINIFLKIRNIRNDKIHTQHVILRKSKTAVNNNNAVTKLKCRYVHSDLLKTAQRYNPKLRFLSVFCFIRLAQTLPPLLYLCRHFPVPVRFL